MSVVLMGRPKRARPIERANYKLDSGVRTMFKELLQIKRLAEGPGVEKAMLQMIAVDRLINKHIELTYQSIEQEVEAIWIELSQNDVEVSID